MKFEELMDEVKAMEFDTVRVDGNHYFEAVILRDKVPALNEKLEGFFGKQLCPPERKLDPDPEKVSSDHGGVMGGQTLYFLKEKDYFYFAMLWPWSDEYHITVKIGRS